MRYTTVKHLHRTEYTSEDREHHAVIMDYGNSVAERYYKVSLWVGDDRSARTETPDRAYAEAIASAHVSKSNPPLAPEAPLAH